VTIIPQSQVKTAPSVVARVFWYLECWGLKRIDAWGVTFIVCALALVIHHALTTWTCLLLVAITANYWLGYWLNDYFDAPHDSTDEFKASQNLFVQHPDARKLVLTVIVLTFGLSAVAFLSFGWRGLVILLMNFLVMWMYSAPPLRLKSRPGLDLLTHALFVQTWPYLICLWLIQSSWTQLDGILLGIFFLTSLNGQLNQQIRDFEVDTRTDTNFATRTGLGKTIFILKVSTLAVVLLSLLAINSGYVPWLFVPLGLLAVPKVAHQMSHRRNKSSRIFPRHLVYIIMLLALLYTSVLMLLEGST
jgi:4-hydroxybenzoate polyprenyltransferase